MSSLFEICSRLASFSDVPKSQAISLTSSQDISSLNKFSIFLGCSLLSHPRKFSIFLGCSEIASNFFTSSQDISSHCKFSIFLGCSLLSHPRKIGFASEKQTNKLICFSLCSRSSKVFSKLKLSLRLSIKKQTSHFVLHSACTIFASILTKLTINLLE